MDDKDDLLLNAIDAAEANSYGGTNNSQIAEDRAEAIRLYLGENVNPAPTGRSQIVSRDVYDTIETMRPAMIKIFASGEEIVKCQPIGPEDEQAADQESAYLNYVATEMNAWTQIVNDVVSDAMICRNGYVLAYWDETKSGDKETYRNQSQDSIQILLSEPGVELVEQSEDVDDDGQPTMTVTIARPTQKGQVKYCVLPPERVKVSERTPDFTLSDCPYFEFWEHKTISYVRQMGFDIEDDIADDLEEVNGSEDNARDRMGETNMREGESVDPAGRLVRLRMVWIRHDYDGDGIAELSYCLIVGRKILFREECSRIAVASFCPIPLPHRHIGLGMVDTTKDIAEAKTAILRQGLDNLYQSNNFRMFASPKINLDDLLTNVPGGIVRGKEGAMMGQDLAPIQPPFMFQQAMSGLEYMDSVRQNRTGTNSYFAGTDQNALNKTASGIAQLSSQASQRVEQIARMFAVGFETLMQITHELILKHGHKAQVVKLRGNWAVVDPRQWKRRSDIRISVGLGTGNKEVVLANLAMLLDRQMATLPMRVTTPKHIYQTMGEIVKAIGFANADKFFVDPDKLGPPPPPPPDPLMVKTQMDAQTKMQVAQIQAQIDVKRLELESLKEHERIMLDKYKVDTDSAVKIQLEQIKQEAGRESMKASQDFESRKLGIPDEVMKQEGEAMLNEYLARSNQLQEQLMAAVAHMNAPRTVVRDEQGRVIGVRPESIGMNQ